MADADPPADIVDRLRLIRTPHVGPVTYRQLLRRFGSARAALDALPDLARRGGRAAAPADPSVVAREIETVRRLGARHLFVDDPAYPALLAQLDDAPAVLTLCGALPAPGRPTVAIVGARNASAAACRFARGLAHDLAAQGATVISGLARGIDTAAHMGARHMALEVNVNNAAAQSLYESYGFEKFSIRKGYYSNVDGTRSDAICMRKAL